MKDQACPLCGNAITNAELESIKGKLSEEHRKAADANERKVRALLADEHRQNLAAEKARMEVESRKQLQGANSQITELTRQLGTLTASQEETKRKCEESADAKLAAEKEKLAAEGKTALLEQQHILHAAHTKQLAEQTAEHRRKDDSMQKQLDAMKRKLEEKTANQLGDGAQINLFDELRRAFPEDELTPVPKGKNGADILHDVRYNGDVCGRIIYESKNCLNWQKAWVSKIRQDKINSDADHAVVSSTVFPPGQGDVYVSDDLIVVNPNRAIYVAQLLRNSLILLNKMAASQRDRIEKTRQLYDFIKSPQFKNRLEQISALADGMEQLHKEEIAAHNRTWNKRGVQITQLNNNVRELDLEICKIIEGYPSTSEFGADVLSESSVPTQPR